MSSRRTERLAPFPRSAWGASAPGKIMIAGEYSVVDGGDAVMMAVDRRAVAELTDEEQERSPFLEEAAAAIAAELGADHPAAAAAMRVRVDSSALRTGDVKLGLGSSAAVTVAAVGCALQATDVDRTLVHRLAHRAHRVAQSRSGAPGSGADVAASVWGGLIVVRGAAAGPDAPLEVEQIALPDDLVLVPVWTGAPADTASLVDSVRTLRDRDRARYDRATGSIADSVRALVAAANRSSACAAVSAVLAGGEAVASLGREAGVELESDVHRTLRRLAERRGGAVKPTGAGAGDLALAAFADPGAAELFRTDIERRGMHCPAVSVDHDGVLVSTPPSY